MHRVYSIYHEYSTHDIVTLSIRTSELGITLCQCIELCIVRAVLVMLLSTESEREMEVSKFSKFLLKHNSRPRRGRKR